MNTIKSIWNRLIGRLNVRLAANEGSAPDFGTGKTFDYRKMVLSLLGLDDQADEGKVMNAYNACMTYEPSEADKAIKSKVAGMEKANEDLKTEIKEKETLAANETARAKTLEDEKTALEKRATEAEAKATESAAAFANERSARIKFFVDGWMKAGVITKAESESVTTELANAKDFDAKLKEMANKKPVMSTTSMTLNLASERTTGVSAQQEIQKMVANEMTEKKVTYEKAWDTVKKSEKGKGLLASMKQPQTASA